MRGGIGNDPMLREVHHTADRTATEEKLAVTARRDGQHDFRRPHATGRSANMVAIERAEIRAGENALPST